jgi:hypothetical protein
MSAGRKEVAMTYRNFALVGAFIGMLVPTLSFGVVPDGTNVGDTPAWDGSQWVADGSLFNDGVSAAVGVGSCANDGHPCNLTSDCTVPYSCVPNAFQAGRLLTQELHDKTASDASGSQPALVVRLPGDNLAADELDNAVEAIRWEGGETKFGKWRQYFNCRERGWELTYNAPWDCETNLYGGRDVRNAAAGLALRVGADVAEGASGQNAYGISFAPVETTFCTDNSECTCDLGTNSCIPDWNAAGTYWFRDGTIADSSGTMRPVEFRIRAPAGIDAQIGMYANTGGGQTLRLALVADGVDEEFRLENIDTGQRYLVIDPVTGAGVSGHRLAYACSGDNATTYCGFGVGSANTAKVDSRLGRSATLGNFQFGVNNSPGSGSWTVTVMLDDVATDVSCTISGTQETCTDAANDAIVVASDSKLHARFVRSGSTGDSGAFQWSFDVMP